MDEGKDVMGDEERQSEVRGRRELRAMCPLRLLLWLEGAVAVRGVAYITRWL